MYVYTKKIKAEWKWDKTLHKGKLEDQKTCLKLWLKHSSQHLGRWTTHSTHASARTGVLLSAASYIIFCFNNVKHSGTLLRHGKIISIFAYVSREDRRSYNVIRPNTNSFITGLLCTRRSLLFLSPLHVLGGDMKGIRGSYLLASSVNMDDRLTLSWADSLHDNETLIRIDWRFLFRRLIEKTCL